MKLTWSEIAINDLLSNIRRYAEQDAITAFRIFDEVKERAGVLGDQPDIGRGGRVVGTKEFVLKHTPFILVYQVQDEQVEILNVLHGAQQWPPAEE